LLEYQENYLNTFESEALFTDLLANADWCRESIFLYGKWRKTPRFTDWAGDAGLNYTYSGVDHITKAWPGVLDRLRLRLNKTLHQAFNFVLLNRYVDGQDSMGWHSDDEAGVGSVIASISLGASRRFLVKKKSETRSRKIDLENGSLLVMSENFQAEHQHAIPKTKRKVGERINLTFRSIQSL